MANIISVWYMVDLKFVMINHIRFNKGHKLLVLSSLTFALPNGWPTNFWYILINLHLLSMQLLGSDSQIILLLKRLMNTTNCVQVEKVSSDSTR